MVTFRQFIELKEKIPGHLASLKDLLGVNPDDFAGEKEPNDPKDVKDVKSGKGGMSQWASFMALGKNTYNGSPYEIVGFKYGSDGEPEFAQVRLINLKGTTRQKYQKKDGKLVAVPDGDDNKTYLIPIKGQEELLTQPWAQAAAQAAAGGGGETPMM